MAKTKNAYYAGETYTLPGAGATKIKVPRGMVLSPSPSLVHTQLRLDTNIERGGARIIDVAEALKAIPDEVWLDARRPFRMRI